MLLRPGYRQQRLSRAGLVGWWPFDDGGTTSIQIDQSGRARNFGTLNGGAVRSGIGYARPAIGGQRGSLKLVAANSQYLDCGTDASLNPGAITVSMWVNPASFPNAYNSLVNRGDGYNFLIRSDGKLALYIHAGGFGNADPAGAVAISANTWSHVSFVFDSVIGGIVYVNAVAVATILGGSPINTTTDNFYIGWQAAQTRPFDGYIDDVRVYNRALTIAELVAIRNEAFQPQLDIETIALMQGSGAPPFTWLEMGNESEKVLFQQTKIVSYRHV